MKRLIWPCAVYLLAEMADILTSNLPGGAEGNPWARDAAYHVLNGHLVALKLVFVFIVFLPIFALWKYAKQNWRWIVEASLAILFCYGAFDAFKVSLMNCLVFLGWYQQ